MAGSTEVDLRTWDNGGDMKFQIKVTEAGFFRAYQIADASEADPKDPKIYAQAETLEKLLTDIAPKVKRHARRINVPFSIWDKGAGYQKDFTGKVRHATVVGVHGGTGNYLVRWDDTGKTTQERDYNLSGALSRLSDPEVRLLTETYASAQAAQDRVNETRSTFAMGTSLKKRVAEAFAALQPEVA